MVGRKLSRRIARGIGFLPNDGIYKIPPPKHLIHQHLEVMPLVVVDGDPDRSILAQQLTQQLQARQHHPEPLGVLQLVVVMLERALRVVGRVDEDAFHPAAVERQQGLEGREVVALDQQVVGTRDGVAVAGDGLQQAVGTWAAVVKAAVRLSQASVGMSCSE